ncbi:MAG: YigZ family protein [Planctomycetes bacterium]|nr:YigZ family protein [Planctomycetota bacterium]
MTDLPDSYRSLERGSEVEIKVKASRFIGQAFGVTTEDEARAHLGEVRKRYHDARHHCSAWTIGPPGSTAERCDDDGEPSGTAGQPILEAVRRDGVHQACVVVTRWFGGTKLGKGGLIRAYDEAARLALDAAPHVTVWCDVRRTARCDYVDVGAVEAILARFTDVVVAVERAFESDPTFVITMRRSSEGAVCSALIEGTSGRVQME